MKSIHKTTFFQGQPSFLQFMLESVNRNHITEDKGLSPEEIEAQSLVFFLAGYETTASTLAFLAYCLATNPDCQEKLLREIDNTVEKGEVGMTFCHITSQFVLHFEQFCIRVNE